MSSHLTAVVLADGSRVCPDLERCDLICDRVPRPDDTVPCMRLRAPSPPIIRGESELIWHPCRPGPIQRWWMRRRGTWPADG